MSQPLLQVFVFRSGSYVGSEVFTEPEIVIGSGEGVDLYLEEAAANHAILNRNDGQATLLDLGSPQGTKVNRASIQHCYVTPRDEIQIAGHTLKLKFVQPARTAPLAPPPAAAAPAAPSQHAGSIEDLISNELATDSAPLSPDVIASVDLPHTPDLTGTDFGSLDDALNSAFVSRDDEPIPVAPSQSGTPQRTDFEPATRQMVPEAPPAPEPLFPSFRSDAPVSLPSSQAAAPQPPASRTPVPQPEEPNSSMVQALDAQSAAPLQDPFDDVVLDDEDPPDEDELEADREPDFSLVEKLIQEGNAREGKKALELLCHRDDALKAATMVSKKGEKIVLGRRRQNQIIPDGGQKGLPLARVLDTGKAEVRVPASADGFVLQHGMRVPLDQLKTPERAVGKKANSYRVPLAAGAQMHLDLGDTSYFLRFIDPPTVKQEPFRFVVEKVIQYAVGGAVGVHLLAFLIVGMSMGGEVYRDLATEQWAEPEVEEIRDVEIEPEPEPEPVVEEEPEPEPDPEPPPPQPRSKPKPKPKPRRSAPKTQQDTGPPKGAPAKEVKKAGVLGAMGKLNLAAPGKKAMVQAVSNVDAVKTPGGSNYRVGALVGKTPSSKLSVGGGGGGKLLTRGSASLLKGGSGLAKIGKKGGSVRGKVARASSRRLQSQGSIDRNAVLKVINSHINEVQYCYEKNLLKDPSLKGKVSVEWTIGGSGSVTRVRQKTSTLRSPQVSSCILQAIKRWRFPKPTGGNVTISFPFVFSQSQF